MEHCQDDDPSRMSIDLEEEEEFIFHKQHQINNTQNSKNGKLKTGKLETAMRQNRCFISTSVLMINN